MFKIRLNKKLIIILLFIFLITVSIGIIFYNYVNLTIEGFGQGAPVVCSLDFTLDASNILNYYIDLSNNLNKYKTYYSSSMIIDLSNIKINENLGKLYKDLRHKGSPQPVISDITLDISNVNADLSGIKGLFNIKGLNNDINKDNIFTPINKIQTSMNNIIFNINCISQQDICGNL
jgi:hypothetical protein